MKIESIQLKHFGPYHQESIPLERVTSGTICGTNGAGKSSGFMDAPLWCLFGKCRIHPDKMITLGETDMAVEMIFLLNDQRYRVIRTRSIRTKAGKSDLQLQVQNGKAWTPIGGKSVSDTQEAIESLLQTNYSLSTSTHFLIQGQFDQVSKATPSQRKALLSDILGIARYADYAVASRQFGSRAEGELGQVAIRVTEFEQAAEQHRVAQTELQRVAAQLAETQTHLDTTKTQHQQAMADQAKLAAQLEVQQAALQASDESYLTSQVQMLQVGVEGKLAQLKAQEGLVAQEPALLLKKDELEQAEHDLTTLKQEQEAQTEAYRVADEALQAAQTAVTQLRKEQTKLTGQQATLNTEVINLRTRIAEYEGVVAQDGERTATVTKMQGLEGELVTKDSAITKCQAVKNDATSRYQASQVQDRTLRDDLAKAISRKETAETLVEQWVIQYKANYQSLEGNIRKAEQQVGLLETVPCTPELQRQCGFTKDAIQVKESDLPKLREDLSKLTTIEEQIRRLAPFDLAGPDEAAKALTTQIESLGLAQLESEKRIHESRFEALGIERRALEQQLQTLRASLPDAAYLAKATADLPSLQKDRLSKEASLLELQTLLSAQETNVQALNLTERQAARVKAWEQLSILTNQLQKRELSIATLRQAVEALPKVQHAKASLLGLREEYAAKQTELTKAQVELTELAKKARICKQLVQDVETATGRVQALNTKAEGLSQGVATLTTQHATHTATLNQTIQAGSQLQDVKKQRDALRDDVQHYAWLTEAYKRVPILLLENALPILEREANRVLETISSSGMTLRIETQKALKSKDELVDTVDIIVRDRVGERPYEAFSGGERMRLDLALRLGLSKLISTRSGSKIQTLIMDEAFAPLDSDGVHRMRQCLAWLEEEYPLVLVITHDDELKDSLGSQIVVTPSSTGSHVEVLS